MSTRRRLRGSLVVCLVVTGLSMPAAEATPATPAPRTTQTTIARPPDDATGSDDQATSTRDAAPAPKLSADLSRPALSTSPDPVVVEVIGSGPAVARAVEAAGGDLGRGGGNSYLATVPGDQLSTLASSGGVTAVSRPTSIDQMVASRPPMPEGGWQPGTSEFVEAWYFKGLKGAGSKVGIVALFDAALLATEVTQGELPVIPAGQRTCVSAGAACAFGHPGQTWGNSLAEIVNDGAPEALLYLAEIGYVPDYYNVIDWFAANGVQIVLNPVVWPYDGLGNGTGPGAAIVDYAVSKGIAWFNTAGEMGVNNSYASYKGGHWAGLWSDPDNDRYLNFSGTDESLSVYCGSLMGLRWKESSATLTDYDLWISDFNYATKGNGTKKLLGGTNQATWGMPLEANNGLRLCNTNPALGTVYDTNADGFVSLWVQRTTRTAGSPVGDLLQIGVYFGWMEHSTTPYSASISFADSANPGMVTVAADRLLTVNEWPYPSEGPTLDGRIKPDLIAYGCVTTRVDGIADMACDQGGFFGADVAAAVQAAWAAMARSAVGIQQPRDLVRYLTNRNLYGAPPNNQVGYGWGQMRYGPIPAPSTASSFVPLDTPQRILDTRGSSGGPIGVPSGIPMSADQLLKVDIPQNLWGAALVVSVTLVRPPKYGWLEIYADGSFYPGATSVLNAEAGQVRANTVIVPIGDARKLVVYSSGGGNVLIDVVGTMQVQPDPGTVGPSYGAGRLTPVTPTRVLDSRTCLGIEPAECTGNPYPNSGVVDLRLKGFVDPLDASNVIPPDATAVALSVTVDSPSAAGFMSVVPGGQTTAPTSNLNYDAGASLTAFAMVKLTDAAAGDVRVLLQRSAHLQVDVLGWFTGATGVVESEGMFKTLTPRRLLDTRLPGFTKPVAGQHVTVSTTTFGVPSNALAIFLNNVSVSSTAPGTLHVSSTAPSPTPGFRNLTYPIANKVIAGATLSRLEAGSFVIMPSASTHVVTDTAGYFMGKSATPAPDGLVTPIIIGDLPEHTSAELMSWTSDGEFALLQVSSNCTCNPVATRYFRWEQAIDELIELPYVGDDITMSDDGSAILMATRDPLVAADLDTQDDLYVYDLANPTPELIDEYWATWGRFSLSPDGDTVTYWYSAAKQYFRATATYSAPIAYGNWFGISPDQQYLYGTTRDLNSCTVTRLSISDLSTLTVIATPCDGFFHEASWDNGVVMLSDDFSSPDTFTVVDLASATSQHFYSTPLPSLSLTGDGAKVYLGPPNSGTITELNPATRVMTTTNLTFDGSMANQGISKLEVTADGRWALMSTGATNIVAGGPADFYLIDLSLLP